MSVEPGAEQWDEGWKLWKGPRLEHVEYNRFRTRDPAGLKSSVLPLDQVHHATSDRNFIVFRVVMANVYVDKRCGQSEDPLFKVTGRLHTCNES